MHIFKSHTLTEQQIKEVEELQERSYLPEGLRNRVFLSNDLNVIKELPCFFLGYEGTILTSFLGAFFPERNEVEFNGFTHPDYRRQGRFSALVEQALALYQQYPFEQVLFQRELNSTTALAYLKSRYPELDHSEYVMKLRKKNWVNTSSGGSLELVNEQNKRAAVAITCASFGESEGGAEHVLNYLLSQECRKTFLYRYEGVPIGIANASEEEGEWVLRGVGTLPDHRNQGHGRRMLSLALDHLFKEGPTAMLEVDSENPPALALYKKLGFQVTAQVDYHRLLLHK